MRYGSAAGFRAALEARLLNESRQSGLSLSRLRKSVVFTRLLARILAVAPNHWVLKGGLAMDYRFGTRVRTTKDIDLAGTGDEDAATEDILAAQRIDLGDSFTFEIERTGRLDALEDVGAVRYHVRCLVAGRLFEEVVLDVGFDLPPGWEPEIVAVPNFLAFADVPPVRTPTLPLELHVAEKLHAYTRPYGQAGSPSTRVKDLIDLVLIGQEGGLDAARLARALRDTFEHRDRHDVPTLFPVPPSEWSASYAKLAHEVGLPSELTEGFRSAERMLGPILDGSIEGAHWDHDRGRWVAS